MYQTKKKKTKEKNDSKRKGNILKGRRNLQFMEDRLINEYLEE